MAELFSRAWMAGVIETFGGALLLFGLFTRPVAFLCSGLMASAYFIAHAPRNFWPILNGGGTLSVDAWLWRASRGAQPARNPGYDRGDRHAA